MDGRDKVKRGMILSISNVGGGGYDKSLLLVVDIHLVSLAPLATSPPPPNKQPDARRSQ